MLQALNVAWNFFQDLQRNYNIVSENTRNSGEIESGFVDIHKISLAYVIEKLYPALVATPTMF